MDVIVENTENLEGVVSAPSSKAYTHRMLIAALLSEGTSRIFNPLISADTQATLMAVRAFGAETEIKEHCWTVQGSESVKTPSGPIDCRESGSTLRFMIPVAALANGSVKLIFHTSFKKRPVAPLLGSLKNLGVDSEVLSERGTSAVLIRGGGIRGGKTSIRGDISSQFISGLLFACPKAQQDTEIEVTTRLESRDYVQMTLEVIAKHGVKVSTAPDISSLCVPSNQSYRPCDHTVTGDFSSAAFLLAAAAITSSKVKVKNLEYQTAQGDRRIVDILKCMGAEVKLGDDYVTVEGKQLCAVDVDAQDIPDLVPVCAVLACYADGTSEIYNAKRLRYKESDRLNALHAELSRMGADIAMEKDKLIISGLCRMHGATVDPHNDHRIAMACAVAALGAEEQTKILNAECVNKSYPQFFEHLRLLGANVVGF